MNAFSNLLDKLHSSEILKHRHGTSEAEPTNLHLGLRFYAAIAMLALALIGVVLTDFAPRLANHYWFYAVPIFAIINIILSWHAAFAHRNYILVWHELLHWLALLLMVFIVYMFIDMGTVSDITAGTMLLSLLALTTFLAGIHFDSMLIVVGIILIVFDLLSAIFIEFSMFIVIPLIIIAAVLIFWRSRSNKKRHKEERIEDDDEFDKTSQQQHSRKYDSDLDDDL